MSEESGEVKRDHEPDACLLNQLIVRLRLYTVCLHSIINQKEEKRAGVYVLESWKTYITTHVSE